MQAQKGRHDGVVKDGKPRDPVEFIKWSWDKGIREHMERHRQRLIEEANTEAEQEHAGCSTDAITKGIDDEA